MDTDTHILILEPGRTALAGLEEKTRGLGFNPSCMAILDHPMEQIKEMKLDLVILGPSFDSETVLKHVYILKIIDPTIPVLTSREDIVGPRGFPGTPFDGIHYLSVRPTEGEISGIIQSAIKQKAEQKQSLSFQALIGQGPEIKEIRQKIKKVSDKDITVLITGETGTGKELIARAIHYHSLRSKGPLVKINCGALPDDLLESEVFGFQRGAFTDAHKDKPGRLEMAHDGTLFIDEIGNLSLSLQVKFLQVLEDRTFTRLGGTEDKIIDTRVVAATNSDLQKKVREGTFRKDLFYRLNIVHIKAPPLRERKEDILLLVHYYMNKYCYELNKDLLDIPDNIADLFVEHPWPGNVRELENIVRLAIILRDWSFAFKELNAGSSAKAKDNASFSSNYLTKMEWDDDKVKACFSDHDFSLKKISKSYVAEAERQAILDTLKETQWNRKKAAQLLKISYKTLLNRIEEFDLKP